LLSAINKSVSIVWNHENIWTRSWLRLLQPIKQLYLAK